MIDQLNLLDKPPETFDAIMLCWIAPLIGYATVASLPLPTRLSL
jgi:hypothetical protein